jgi:hypothetical protein
MVLHSEIEITENGQRRTVEVVEALLKREVKEGLRGNLLAIRSALDRYERHTGSQPEHDEDMAEEDKAILERLMQPRGSTPGKRGKQGGGTDQ